MEPATYTFQDISVDTRTMAVARAGATVPLEPKAVDVLLFLIAHRDRLVTKEELLDHVWKDTFVTPNVLTRVIAQIRKGLGDDARESQIIETIAKRGYRFIAVLKEDADVVPAVVVPHLAPAGRRRGWVLGTGVTAAVVLVAATMAWWQPWRRAGRPIETSTPRRLTTGGGYNGIPEMSPDGRSVAYVSDRSGSREIYVAGLAAGSREVAITSDGGQNAEPSWSPDGQWIAFHSEKNGGVWVTSAAGGVARRVVEFGSRPSWSADSQRLVFTSDAGGMASQSTIWTVNVSGADRREITRTGQPAGGHRAPVWSHSGRFVVFNVHDGGSRSDVWAVDLTSGAAHEVIKAAWGERVSISVDDRWIYMAAWLTAGPKQISRVPIDPVSLELTGPVEVVVPDRGGDIDGLSIARNGQAVFAVATDENNLWSLAMKADGTADDPVIVTRDAVRNTYASLARDGRIAFQQFVVGRPVSTWILNAAGTDREPVLPGTDAIGPEWDRENARLLVQHANRLTWVDLTTRRTTDLPIDLTEVKNWRLSPDERAIAFHKILPNGSMNIWTQPLAGGPEVQVTHDREAAGYPAWSPDGKWLAVEIKRLDHTHIGVVPSDGRGPIVQLTDTPGQSWPRSWAPDSDRIAFAGQRDGVWNIFTVSRSTKVTRQLTHYTSQTGFVRYPAWSPDGSRVVYERAVRLGAVWAFEIK